MKKEILAVSILFSLFTIIIVTALEPGKDIMTVEANILAPSVSIEVPDYIFLGNVSLGYKTNSAKVYINNTGTTNMTVTPELKNSSEIVFSYLYFQRRTTEAWKRIGNFSINLPKPADLGDIEDEYFYMKLDLTNFEGELENDMLGHKTDIIFWAMPQ